MSAPHARRGDAHVVRSSHALVFSYRLCFDSRSLAWCGLAGFAILEAPVELAIPSICHSNKIDHRETPGLGATPPKM